MIETLLSAYRGSQIASLIGTFGLGLLLCGGCSEPVDYSAQATPEAADEAPPFDAEPADAEASVDAAEATPAESDPTAETPSTAAEEERLIPATPPWRPLRDQAEEAEEEPEGPESEQAQRFFGGLPQADEAEEDTPSVGDRYSAAPGTSDEDDEGYLEFLQKQFGMTEDAEGAADERSEPLEEPQEAPADDPPSTPSLAEIEIAPKPDAGPPQLPETVPVESESEPLVEERPAPAPKSRYADPGLGLKIGKLEMPGKKPKPKPQLEPESESTDPLIDLPPIVAEQPPVEQTTPEPSAEVEETPPPAVAELDMPWQNPDDGPVESSPELADLPAPDVETLEVDPFDDPASRTAASTSPVEEPASADDQLLVDLPEPAPELPAEAPAVELDESAAPARVAVEPLPSVPVLPYNTRHLAWLLGGKLGLAQLAGVQGATPAEVQGWTEEATRLAEQLDLNEPAPPVPTGSAERRLKQLLSTSAALADGVARKHGEDHAALVEISLKTNALLVMFEDHPELAGPVARSVTSAAERAMLPGRLWRDATRRVEYAESSDELYDAVTQMHADVEAYLR